MPYLELLASAGIFVMGGGYLPGTLPPGARRCVGAASVRERVRWIRDHEAYARHVQAPIGSSRVSMAVCHSGRALWRWIRLLQQVRGWLVWCKVDIWSAVCCVSAQFQAWLLRPRQDKAICLAYWASVPDSSSLSARSASPQKSWPNSRVWLPWVVSLAV